jgi:hypothetical protein
MPSRRTFVAATLAGTAVSTLSADSALQSSGKVVARRRRILVFDVNETMLDITALEPHFARAFGNGQVQREWFSTLLFYSNVVTQAGPYADFSALAGAVLDMVAETRGVRLPSEDRNRVLAGTRSLPAHADVRPAPCARAVAQGRLPSGDADELRTGRRRTAVEERRTR